MSAVTTKLTPMPPAPTQSDPESFDQRADAHVQAQVSFVSQMNAIIDQLNNSLGNVNFGDLFASRIFLGGVGRTAWQSSVGGHGSAVFTGTVTLGGADGVVVTHNLGHVNYQISITPLEKPERVGAISYTRSSNTLTIRNTGQSGIAASLLIFNDADMSNALWRWTHPGELMVLGQLLANGGVSASNVLPIDSARSLGSSALRWSQGHFAALTLGGASRSSWPTAVAGSNGNVVMSGGLTLGGIDSVVVTHNIGHTSYMVKVMPNGIPDGRVGEIAVVRASNTVTIRNTGFSGVLADFEISIIA